MPVGPDGPVHYRSSVVPASDPPPKVETVQAPLPRVTVSLGDTLSGIGARTHRTWQQLAGWNHLPNPDLIFVGQVFTIPLESYVPPLPTYTPPATPAVSISTSGGGGGSETQVAPVQRASSGTAGPSPSGVWGCIAQHESGMQNDNTGNGYFGYFQFDASSWTAAGGGPGGPTAYSYSQQLAVAQHWQAMAGWGAWPNTSVACGV